MGIRGIGVPMEVMGLMLGEFVDDYTVRVVDVSAFWETVTGADFDMEFLGIRHAAERYRSFR